MARNGSGTYSKVNTFVAGNTITASGHNQNWDDLATEMTNSVAADGQTSMTGALKLSSGTAAAPAAVFASDTDTGMYRIGSNNIGFAVGGSKVLDLSSSACNTIGAVKQNGFALLPIGTVFPYAGSSAPSGYLFCYGQAVSRTTYADLFAVIGTTYGTGDGSTTFNLPDLRGRVVAGKDDMGGSAASRLTSTYFGTSAADLNATGGGESSTLVTANLPPYTPAGTNSASSIQIRGNTSSYSAGANSGLVSLSDASGTSITNPTQTFTGTPQGGTSTPVRTVQPTLILNYIIFAGA